MKDFYSVLSLPRGCTPKEVKDRFRELARTRHPDRFQGEEKQKAELEFQEISEAFNVLIDAKRRAELDSILDRPPDQEPDHQQTGKVLLSRGVKAYREGNYLEAASTFHRATEADPTNPKIWYHLAMACVQEKRWLPKGQEAIDRANRLRENHAPYLKLAGKIYALSGNTRKAREYYTRASNLGNHDPEIQQALRDLGGGSSEPPVATTEETGKKKGGLFGKLF